MAKVLLVEDDNNLREIFEMRLQAEGYDTVTASDGEEALSIAMKEKPDLIIADVMMPKLSGFEMLETLRAAPEMNNIKVIMMTALGQAEDRIRGEKLGVVKYLVKSQVTLEDFVRVVRDVVQPDKSGAAPAATNASTNNSQGSEPTMQNDQTPTNPAPAGDPAAAPGSDPAMPAPAPDAAQTSAQEQNVVNDQINDFAAAPAAPAPLAMDNPVPAPDIPAASPPPAPTEEGPAQTPQPPAPGNSFPTAPTTPNAA